MVKRNDDVDDLTDDLIDNLDEDRLRLTSFFDKLLGMDSDTHMIAEQVAKLSDALTRQSALRMEAIKAKLKARPAGESADNDESFDEIGRPFTVEEEGGN